MTRDNNIVPKLDPKVVKIMSLLRAGGASEVLVVGGYVRDLILNLPSKDVDLEVYGLDYEQISGILSRHFRVNLVGRSFGVLKVDNAIDVALPRRESKMGSGHKGFDVRVDSTLRPEEAFARRDFTINAIGMRGDGSLVDPYHGADDLRAGILRATSEAFKEDPLRVLRGMQFVARFGFAMEERTVRYSREVLSEFDTLSPERVYEEWVKWAIKGRYPGKGLDVLLQTGWIDKFPELKALVGCAQSAQWHSEGDVWEHTKLVCDEMARILDVERDCPPTKDERVSLMFAALGHDFGKPAMSVVGPDGMVHSPGHAAAGGPLVVAFLERARAPKIVVETVERLVVEHMSYWHENDPSARIVRRLSCRLKPATIRQWTMLVQADSRGTKSLCEQNAFPAERWLEKAREAQVVDAQPDPFVLGRHLVSRGMTPGPRMGEILNAAYEAQLDGEFTDTDSGLAWLRARGDIPEETSR